MGHNTPYRLTQKDQSARIRRLPTRAAAINAAKPMADPAMAEPVDEMEPTSTLSLISWPMEVAVAEAMPEAAEAAKAKAAVK